jgi:hypothetical protein
MPDDNDMMPYSSGFHKRAWNERNEMEESHRLLLHEIIFKLTENPGQYPNRTFGLTDNVMVYRHPDPQIEVTYMIDHDMKKIMILHVVAPRFKVSKPLFISYSHNDEVWMKELKKWLKPLEQSDLIDVWDDTRIQPGQDWREEIQKALDDARLAILLVSQDFLTSEFISNDELPKLLDSAKNKGVEILWIAVSSCTVDDTPIARYQAVHKEPPLDLLSDPEKKEKLLRIYEKIKSVVNN